MSFLLVGGVSVIWQFSEFTHTTLLNMSWMPRLGINLTFYLDGLNLMFVVLLAGTGGFIFMYSEGYFHEEPHSSSRFQFLLTGFLVSMLGLVLSGNVILLFVFWELTSLFSFLLIGFYHRRNAARYSAQQSILITGGGGLVLLAGLILLGEAAGSYNIAEMVLNVSSVQTHPFFIPGLLCVCVGAFTKSAQVPFHFWLPNAMEAPTPASAFLHSATMVKAGIFLLLRLHPLLATHPVGKGLMLTTGGVTAFYGTYLAFSKNHVKKILAYSTISGLGFLVCLTGIGTSEAVAAAVIFLIAHALYKATLFLVAGSIYQHTGTLELKKLGGLFKKMPVTGTTALLGCASMAGFPPLIGFLAKEEIYRAVLESPTLVIPLILTVVLASILIVGTAVKFFVCVFLAPPNEHFDVNMEGTFLMWFPAITLGIFGLIAGVIPGTFSRVLVEPAISSVILEKTDFHLSFWHGITPPLILEAVTISLGLLLFVISNRFSFMPSRTEPSRFSLDSLYDLSLLYLKKGTEKLYNLLQHGYLRHYIFIILLSVLSLIAWALFFFPVPKIHLPISSNLYFEAAICFFIAVSAVITVVFPNRLTAIISLGVVGYGLATLFIYYGATDLAITQFVIETLTVIMFVLVFYKLSEEHFEPSLLTKTRDLIIAVGGGATLTYLTLLNMNIQYSPSVTNYFIKNSYEKAHGKNIVNVILVDFRALDTLGEITVLATAGLGVFALVKFMGSEETT